MTEREILLDDALMEAFYDDQYQYFENMDEAEFDETEDEDE